MCLTRASSRERIVSELATADANNSPLTGRARIIPDDRHARIARERAVQRAMALAPLDPVLAANDSLSQMVGAMRPGDRIIIERHAPEPGKAEFTITVKRFE